MTRQSQKKNFRKLQKHNTKLVKEKDFYNTLSNLDDFDVYVIQISTTIDQNTINGIFEKFRDIYDVISSQIDPGMQFFNFMTTPPPLSPLKSRLPSIDTTYPPPSLLEISSSLSGHKKNISCCIDVSFEEMYYNVEKRVTIKRLRNGQEDIKQFDINPNTLLHVFPGEGDQIDGQKPGDLKIKMLPVLPDNIKIKGNDVLFITAMSFEDFTQNKSPTIDFIKPFNLTLEKPLIYSKGDNTVILNEPFRLELNELGLPDPSSEAKRGTLYVDLKIVIDLTD